MLIRLTYIGCMPDIMREAVKVVCSVVSATFVGPVMCLCPGVRTVVGCDVVGGEATRSWVKVKKRSRIDFTD